METSPNRTSVESLYVAPLQRFSRADIEQAGGKATNLGELIQAGFSVPDGFVVTTAGYDLFVEDGSLYGVIPRILQEQQGGERIRSAFESTALPPDLAQEIQQAYHWLGAGPVAVRSSATAEDLPAAAFAGQQDTYLNVIGEQALLNAVRSCWASLWTDRAMAYRERQGIDQQAVKLAVVVQRMAAAEAAGVMFTANPVTGERGEITIDASPGLGEAVVSGATTPDHYVLVKQRSGWAVTHRRAGRREVIVRPRPAGGTEQIAGAATSPGFALPEPVLPELAGLGQAIQSHFGVPQDIEWAWDGKELFILQARPITALPEPPPHPGKLVRMLSGIFAEMFPIRPYPLDLTTWVPAISDAAVTPLFSLIGILAPTIDQNFIEEDGVVIRFSGQMSLHPTPAILLAPLRLLWLALRHNPIHWRADPLLQTAQSQARALEASDLSAYAWDELLATVRQALSLALPLAGEMRRRYYPRALLSAGLLRVTLASLGKGDRFAVLLSGAESVTLEVNRALARLAACINAAPTLKERFAQHQAGELWAALAQDRAGQAFLDELRLFLDRYGYREASLSTALQPTWKDDPSIVLGMLKGLAEIPPQVEEHPQAARPAWEAARDEVLTHPLLSLKPLCRAFLGLLHTARCFWSLREDTHFEATRILPILRRTLLEMGHRLVEAGVLDRPENIFHLIFNELDDMGVAWPPSPEMASDLRASVLRRKRRRDALEGTPVVDPRLYLPAEPDGDILLRGAPGSPGLAAGPVRVIHSPAEFHRLRSGDVLVAPFTNPAWTPLFQQAVAVVVDSGGTGSHAAIVAREYGVPAVMGTVKGTQKLSDGEWVQVDGTRGLILPAPGHTANEKERPGKEHEYRREN